MTSYVARKGITGIRSCGFCMNHEPGIRDDAGGRPPDISHWCEKKDVLHGAALFSRGFHFLCVHTHTNLAVVFKPKPANSQLRRLETASDDLSEHQVGSFSQSHFITMLSMPRVLRNGKDLSV